jgi:hypothetical protein
MKLKVLDRSLMLLIRDVFNGMLFDVRKLHPDSYRAILLILHSHCLGRSPSGRESSNRPSVLMSELTGSGVLCIKGGTSGWKMSAPWVGFLSRLFIVKLGAGSPLIIVHRTNLFRSTQLHMNVSLQGREEAKCRQSGLGTPAGGGSSC